MQQYHLYFHHQKLKLLCLYQRLLNYIQPDIVHVLKDGRIVKTGGKELSLELEERGYDWVVEEPLAAAA